MISDKSMKKEAKIMIMEHRKTTRKKSCWRLLGDYLAIISFKDLSEIATHCLKEVPS